MKLATAFKFQTPHFSYDSYIRRFRDSTESREVLSGGCSRFGLCSLVLTFMGSK